MKFLNHFEIHTGVRQGDGLSPLLFNTVLDKIIKEWENKVKGIQLGKTRANQTTMKCLEFADDLVILSDNRQEAQEALDIYIFKIKIIANAIINENHSVPSNVQSI